VSPDEVTFLQNWNEAMAAFDAKAEQLLAARRDDMLSEVFVHKMANRAHGLALRALNLSRQIGYAPEPKPGSNVVELAQVRARRG
jgi:hypothetical protein